MSALFASAAQAYQLNADLDCTDGFITGYSKCSGAYKLGRGENDVTNGSATNIVTQILNEEDVFEVGGDWKFGNKFDGDLSSQNNDDGFSVAGLNTKSGSFSFSELDLAKTDLAISLKSAKGFSLYYVAAGSITDPEAIQWNTAGTSVNKKGNGKALSHISYYTRIIEAPALADQIRRVPEPATISALLAVGTMAIMRQKRKQGS
ncbi:PEP-CTERM sorting domain-containing protein [filamentous cyanobacterium LEGE 11480]|uniref:PEP-CTERM sorting domain-containing protein n=1 Tax=Romeriopsis navalis LEGE 11480 TaxID=2777977 RepID=A0A928Z458_9CYAN|nr:PEP-CTERM sorting domain-containing protein [Romeriopsis navalis]MBE9029988.1 PEP-CTERM sorting domain-containing protein [Romeriopsis navalis LEGE 11480]